MIPILKRSSPQTQRSFFLFFFVFITTLTKLHICLLTLTVTYLQSRTLFTGFFFAKKNSSAITVFFNYLLMACISIVKLFFSSVNLKRQLHFYSAVVYLI